MRLLVLVFSLLPGLVIAQAVCPVSFEQFLFRFELDRTFQQQNILYPLRYSFIDLEASPEPRAVFKPLSKTEVATRNKPIYPSVAHQTELHLEKNVNLQSTALATVRLWKPDTGYVLIYRFKQIGRCWKLIELEDAST